MTASTSSPGAAAIRRAAPADAEAIIALIEALTAFVQDPPTRLTAEDIRRDGFGPEAWFDGFLAEQDGRSAMPSVISASAQTTAGAACTWPTSTSTRRCAAAASAAP